MAPPDDQQSLPGWTRYAVLGAVGVALFLAFAMVDTEERSKPTSGADGTAVEPVLAARGGIQAVAVKVREDLASFGPQVVEGIARGRAERALQKEREKQGDVRAALLASAQSEDWSERWVALLVIYRYGTVDPPMMRVLMQGALEDPNERARLAAQAAVANLRDADDEAVDVLREALERETLDPAFEAAVLRALVRTGGGANDIERLGRALESGAVEVRRSSAYGIARVDFESAPANAHREAAVEMLTRALGDDDGEVRMYASMGLSRFGADAEPAIASLVRLLSDDEEYVVGWASTALARIGPTSRPALAATLAAGDRARSSGVVWVLRQLAADGRPDREPAVEVLREGMAHDDPVIAARSATALHALGAPVPEVLPVLRKSLVTDDVTATLVAIEGLGRLGREARPARADLEALIEHHDERVRRAASTTLEGLPADEAGTK